MSKIVLGLDIGGANLKAATSAGRAVSLPFPLWKQPDKLAASLAGLVAQFPEATELAVTMTGELCDCFATKREGVCFILNALPADRPVQVWSTAGQFVSVADAAAQPIKVAAANWHAAATFCGRWVDTQQALFIDIGSTTTDIILLNHGIPSTWGNTDFDRLTFHELVYTGVKRTPVCAVKSEQFCAEFFAEMRDVNILLGLMPESPGECDTADGRPATWECSLARLARMSGGDMETLSENRIIHEATGIHSRQVRIIAEAIRKVVLDQQKPIQLGSVIVAGTGEWLALKAFQTAFPEHGAKIVSSSQEVGPAISASVAAYAVAVLSAEGQS